MSKPMHSVQTLDLAERQMLVLDGGHGARVRVLRGAAWLTSEGDLGDRVLEAGAELPLGPGRTLIEALGPVRVRVWTALMTATAIVRQEQRGRPGTAARARAPARRCAAWYEPRAQQLKPWSALS